MRYKRFHARLCHIAGTWYSTSWHISYKIHMTSLDVIFAVSPDTWPGCLIQFYHCIWPCDRAFHLVDMKPSYKPIRKTKQLELDHEDITFSRTLGMKPPHLMFYLFLSLILHSRSMHGWLSTMCLLAFICIIHARPLLLRKRLALLPTACCCRRRQQERS